MAAPNLPGVTAYLAGKRHARMLKRQARADDRAAILSQGKWNDVERFVRANMNRSSETWALYRGEIFLGVVGVMCFGRSEARPGYQYPWWLLTQEAEDASLLPAARALVEHFRDEYPLLIATVRASDTKAASALEACGFSLMAPAKFGESPDLWCKAVLDTRKLVEVAHA